MMEISQHQALDQEVLSDSNQVAGFDVVCYIYDSSDPNSFGYIASLRVLSRFNSLIMILAKIRGLDQYSQHFCREQK
jgi:hypothetical protein